MLWKSKNTSIFGALGFALGSFFHSQAPNLFWSLRQIIPSSIWWIASFFFIISIGLFGGMGLGILLKNRKKLLLFMLIGSIISFLQHLCIYTFFDEVFFTSYLIFAPLMGIVFALVYNNWRITRNFMIASIAATFFIFLLVIAIRTYMDMSGNLFNINPSLFYQTRDFLKLFPYFGFTLLGGVLGYLTGKIELKQRQENL